MEYEPVIEVISTIVSASFKIYKFAKDVKANKKRCQRLAKRTERIRAMVTEMQTVHELKELDEIGVYMTVFSKTLGVIKQSFADIESFIETFAKKSKRILIRCWSHGEMSEKISYYNEDLDRYIFELHAAFVAECSAYTMKNLKEIKQILSNIESRNAQVNYFQIINMSSTEETQVIPKYSPDPAADEYAKEEDKIADGWQLFRDDQSKDLIAYYKVIRTDEVDMVSVKEMLESRSAKFYHGSLMKAPVMVKKFNFLGTRTENDKQKFYREACLLELFESPYIVRLIGIINDPEYCAMVMEDMGGVDRTLRMVLLNKSLELSWLTRMRMALNVTLAVYRLHKGLPSMRHRRLTSDKFLVGEGNVVKMCGVGFSSTAELSQHHSKLNFDSGRSTVAYLAPEQAADIRLNTFFGEIYRMQEMGFHTINYLSNFPPSGSLHADCQYVGVILAEIAAREEAYAGMDAWTIQQLLSSSHGQLSPMLPSDAPGVYIDLCNRCRSRELWTRPDIGDVVDELKSIICMMEVKDSVRNNLEVDGEKDDVGMI